MFEILESTDAVSDFGKLIRRSRISKFGTKKSAGKSKNDRLPLYPTSAARPGGVLCEKLTSVYYIFWYMKSDANGCQRLHEIARGALKACPFVVVGELEGVGRRVGKLLERR